MSPEVRAPWWPARSDHRRPRLSIGFQFGLGPVRMGKRLQSGNNRVLRGRPCACRSRTHVLSLHRRPIDRAPPASRASCWRVASPCRGAGRMGRWRARRPAGRHGDACRRDAQPGAHRRGTGGLAVVPGRRCAQPGVGDRSRACRRGGAARGRWPARRGGSERGGCIGRQARRACGDGERHTTSCVSGRRSRGACATGGTPHGPTPAHVAGAGCSLAIPAFGRGDPVGTAGVRAACERLSGQRAGICGRPPARY